jgi:hypothetical protein
VLLVLDLVQPPWMGREGRRKIACFSIRMWDVEKRTHNQVVVVLQRLMTATVMNRVRMQLSVTESDSPMAAEAEARNLRTKERLISVLATPYTAQSLTNMRPLYSILAMDATQRGSKPIGEATIRRCCTFK